MPVFVPLRLPAGASASAASGVGPVGGLADDLGTGAFALAVLLWVVLLARVVRHESASRPAVTDWTSSVQDAQRSLAERFVAGEMSTREFLERGSALDWVPETPWSGPLDGPSPWTAAPRHRALRPE